MGDPSTVLRSILKSFPGSSAEYASELPASDRNQFFVEFAERDANAGEKQQENGETQVTNFKYLTAEQESGIQQGMKVIHDQRDSGKTFKLREVEEQIASVLKLAHQLVPQSPPLTGKTGNDSSAYCRYFADRGYAFAASITEAKPNEFLAEFIFSKLSQQAEIFDPRTLNLPKLDTSGLKPFLVYSVEKRLEAPPPFGNSGTLLHGLAIPISPGVCIPVIDKELIARTVRVQGKDSLLSREEIDKRTRDQIRTILYNEAGHAIFAAYTGIAPQHRSMVIAEAGAQKFQILHLNEAFSDLVSLRETRYPGAFLRSRLDSSQPNYIMSKVIVKAGLSNAAEIDPTLKELPAAEVSKQVFEKMDKDPEYAAKMKRHFTSLYSGFVIPGMHHIKEAIVKDNSK